MLLCRLARAIQELRKPIDRWVDWLGQYFNWQNVGGFVGLLAGTVGAILMAADAYLPAEVCFGISGATLFLWALTLRSAWLLRISIAAFFVGGTWYLVATVDQARVTRILEANFGILKPANDSMPASDDCTQYGHPIEGRFFTIYFGNSTFMVQSLPFSVLQIGQDKFFIVSRLPDGRMVISARIVDKDGKVIVTIDENGFRVNQNNIFYKERRDESTIIVYDQFNKMVLYVRFNSPKHMTISTIVNYFDKVIVTADQSILINGRNFSHSCVSGIEAGIYYGPPP